MSLKKKLSKMALVAGLTASTLVNTSALSGTESMTINATKLFSQNSLEYTVLMEVPKGETVTVVSENGEWSQVEYKGQQGYIHSIDIQPLNNKPIKETLEIFKVADILSSIDSESHILETTGNGDVIHTTGFEGDYYELNYNGVVAYIKKSDVDKWHPVSGQKLYPFNNARSIIDIRGHWAENEIVELANSGIIMGYEDNTFRPNNVITRAEFTTMINRYFGFDLETVPGDSIFSDVQKYDWYHDTVSIGATRGFINGYSDGTFKPNNEITREEACKILAVILKAEDPTIDLTFLFDDANSVSPWAKEFVEGILETGIMQGDANNNLNPKGNLTRAESVMLFSRIDKDNSDKTEGYAKGPTFSASKVTVTVGDSLNLQNKLKATCSITGQDVSASLETKTNVNTSVIGKHLVTVVATGTNGSKSEREIIIEVIENHAPPTTPDQYEPPVEPTPPVAPQPDIDEDVPTPPPTPPVTPQPEPTPPPTPQPEPEVEPEPTPPPTPQPEPEPQPEPTPPVTDPNMFQDPSNIDFQNAIQEQFNKRINADRKALGHSQIAYADRTAHAAEMWSEYMFENKTVAHSIDGKNGKRAGSIYYAKTGEQVATGAECIARVGFDQGFYIGIKTNVEAGIEFADKLYDAWYNSEGHKDIMLAEGASSTNFTGYGLGLYFDGNSVYATLQVISNNHWGWTGCFYTPKTDEEIEEFRVALTTHSYNDKGWLK